MSSWHERWQNLWRFLNTPLFTSPPPGTSNPSVEATELTPGWTARRYGAIARLGLTWMLTLLI